MKKFFTALYFVFLKRSYYSITAEPIICGLGFFDGFSPNPDANHFPNATHYSIVD